MTLEQDIEDIRVGIKSGRFMNQALVSQGIVLRILHTLSWPTYDTQVVFPQYSQSGRQVDYALCHPANKPIAFVEVKQPWQSNEAKPPFLQHALQTRVPIVVSTNGQKWNFFLSSKQDRSYAVGQNLLG
ncbi:hypothetical protein CCP3SC1AL1_270002 [Gammaproteobacteria bacterium]